MALCCKTEFKLRHSSRGEASGKACDAVKTRIMNLCLQRTEILYRTHAVAVDRRVLHTLTPTFSDETKPGADIGKM